MEPTEPGGVEGRANERQKVKTMSALEKRALYEELPDEDLIQRVAAGEKTAFDILVKRHKGRLYNYLLRLLRDPSEAEEIAQETLVRAYLNAEKYRTIAKFTTWLYTIGTNLVRNRIRKRKSTPLMFSLSWGRGEDDGEDRGSIDLPDDKDLPDRELEKDELHALVARGIEKIPAKYREAFALREINHFTYEEIALITGLKLGTVRSRINRGRGHFREIMEPVLKKAMRGTGE